MFDLRVLNKYTDAKDALGAVNVIRNFYKDRWTEADEAKDNDALDEIDVRLSELDVMQVELEKTLSDCKEFLEQ